MAKRRANAVTDSITKKLKQVRKATSNGANPRKKTDAGSNVSEEEKTEKKVKPKSNVSLKGATTGKKLSAQITKKNTQLKASKYFQSAVKEEEQYGSEDDFDITTPAAPALAAKMEKDKEEEDSEEDEGDWEEVEELTEPLGPVKPSEPVLPSEPVEIEIETPEIRKRKKRQAEWETYIRRMVNRYKKDVLIDTHKVHLMCLIANGMFRNRLCSEPDLLAVTLSLLPAQCSIVTKDRIDQSYLSRLLQWFKTTFTLNTSLPCEESPDARALLERRLASLSARNHQEMTHLFLLFLRSLQLFCRLVLSLQPIPLKLPPAKEKAAAAVATHAKSNTKQETSKSSTPESKISPGNKRPSGRGKSKGDSAGKRAKKSEIKEEETVKGPGGQRPKNSKRRSVASKVSYKEESGSDEEQLSDEEFRAMSEEEDSTDSESEAKSAKQKTGRTRGKPNVKDEKKRRSSGDTKSAQEEDRKREEDDDDDDFEEERGVTRGSKAMQRNSQKREGPGVDEWLEVYLEKTSSWVCVDVEHGVALPHLCSRNATAPMTYVVSVDGDGFVKDLGRKYDPTWMTSSRKRRVDEVWWEETLEPFLGPEDERDRKEEKEMQKKLMDKPLPISVAEYKNHPLYALRRHLLKYEAIYPSTAAVLGYCRGEPVYSRDCVHTLHSKDTWLKEARTVRLGEEPYKMVKGFSNRSRKARMMSETKDDNDLPLFGEWQTEEYQPPIAVDGKVPRNDYGNVYLFKPSMLPVGCIHLQLPNLHRVARKLDIDAAPAVTGFDFHGGYSHAVTDGYIVCEEHEEILRTAWVEEQTLQKQKEKEKREKRVISNWTLLVKGLLIREKLKQRYNKKKEATSSLAQGQETGGLSSDEEAAEGGSPEEKSTAETLAMAWPQNRQTEEDDCSQSGLKKKKMSKRERKGQEKHLFPFEKI